MNANEHSIANRNAVYHAVPESHRFSMRQQIIDYLREHGPATRDEVAIALGKQVHEISGRFTALLKAEVLEETQETRPTRTGHQAVVLQLKGTSSEADR